LYNNDEHILMLLQGCRLNNRNNQQQLFELLKEFAIRICYRYVSSFHDAEEVMNESFVKLFVNMVKFDEVRTHHHEAALKGWFKRIIINTCIDHLRRNAAFIHTLSVDDAYTHLADAGENSVDKMAYKEIIDCIRELTPAYRAVFNLFVIEGRSHEEIAEALNISIGSSKSNLSKARENLRKIIIKKLHPEAYVEH
jgi:RNA polymerase sigma factor (sigma-70 family)